MALLAKWWATALISWQKQLSYKLNLLLLVIGPSLVFFFVKYSLWTAVYQVKGVEKIQGYDVQGMLDYQLWSLIVAYIIQGYNSMNLAEDIRIGRISAFLVYPFGFWSFQTASFLAFEALQLVIALLTLALMNSAGFITTWVWPQLLMGLGFSLLLGCFWYQVCYVIGLAAFWLEETWVLRVMFMTIAQFLSGAILPLEIYPKSLVRILEWTPFPYLTYVPVKVFMGQYQGDLLQAIGIVGFWMLMLGLFTQGLWKRGIRLYTAAGM